MGDLSIPHLPWVLTESPRPWGMLRCGRDCAGGSVGQLLGCWNERAAAVSVSPKQAEGRGCTCREGLGEEQQGDAEELWQIHRNLLLQGGRELGPGVGLCCHLGAEVPVLHRLPPGWGLCTAKREGPVHANACSRFLGLKLLNQVAAGGGGLPCTLWCCTGSSRVCLCKSPRAQLSLLPQVCEPPRMNSVCQGILHRHTFTRRCVWLCLGRFAPFQRCY